MMNNVLINRGALIDYFEGLARALAKARCFNAADAIQGAAEKVKNAPAVDAVEVVWCRDCRYRGLSIECPMCFEECYDYDGYSEYHTIDNAVDDGFCDRGERWSDEVE